jgi:DNA-binding winged helix-turn-helix (wHTH) protein
VTVRILADREPYASFSDQTPPQRDSYSWGPPALDSPTPDFVVLPVSDFLALELGRSRFPGFIAYGVVALMGAAFDRGCADYLREPWSLPELVARLRRLENCRFKVDGKLYRVEDSFLLGEGASVELGSEELAFLRLLLKNAPLPVAREVAEASLAPGADDDGLTFRRRISSLRRSLKRLSPSLGELIRPVRDFGYRTEGVLCG